MAISKNNIRLLGLSTKEIKVLRALQAGKHTPLTITDYTKISRPAIYEILDRLNRRGFVKHGIKDGKKYWAQVKSRDLENKFYDTQKQFLNTGKGIQEIRNENVPTVIVYRGISPIRKLLYNLFKNHKNQRLYSIQGDAVTAGWTKIFGIKNINEINRLVKKNKIITDGIVPSGWFERQTKSLGVKWAKDFEGRAAITNEIEPDYFQHGGQMFIFKDSMYLIDINNELVIEVRNSEIQRLVLFMFQFIQNNSHKIDVNRILRELSQS